MQTDRSTGGNGRRDGRCRVSFSSFFFVLLLILGAGTPKVADGRRYSDNWIRNRIAANGWIGSISLYLALMSYQIQYAHM